MIPGISRWELLSVEKPARYLGGEWNQAAPKPNAKLRVCLAFPDIYELGMSNIALKILYEILDQQPEVAVERVFSPWIDFEQLLKRKNIPLFSLETKTPIKEFDLLGITLPYELTFTNVLNLLELSRIPVFRKNRDSFPLIVGGGPSASNPLPLADFFDAFLIGEGEEAIIELVNLLVQAKFQRMIKSEILERISELEGFWVPAFPKKVKRRVFNGFSKFSPPLRPIVPTIECVHDRIPLEIFRGCTQGCRFCNAGYLYRPRRDRSPDLLAKCASIIEANTGDEVIGLVSLSTSDYPHLNKLICKLDEEKLFPDQIISIPSLRMTQETISFLEKSNFVKKSGLTFAPEAGSQRMRDLINKNITEEEIIQVIIGTENTNYRSIKLYFMIGLPCEQDEDLDAIVDLILKIENIVRSKKMRKDISVSLSGFVPKPFTPFQWAAQNSIEQLREKRIRICNGLKKSKAKISWRTEEACRLEAVISRGDERVAKLIFHAFKNNCIFDGWTDQFNIEGWQKAFIEASINPDEFTKEYPIDAPLPWDFIDFRTPQDYLKNEYITAINKINK